MARIKTWLAYFMRQAGPLGILGILLLGSVPAYYLVVARSLESTAAALQAEYISARDRTATVGEIHRTDATRQERIRDFHNFFPLPHTALGWTGKVYEVAEREGLQLAHGEYRPTGNQNKSPLQWQIILPVRGSYAQIRRFITGVLAEIPFISLDEIDFQRNADGKSGIDAKLLFTLYLRGKA